ncbi:MAG: hypothetical protein R3C59_24850 [Planctomycetaceae bacterium]
MSQKQPVLLIVLIQTSRMRWLAAGIDFDRNVIPLLVSQENDLAGYRGLSLDEQASFLRHRFCGVVQRGCDRLFGSQKKACQFVFLIEHPFPDAEPTLTDSIAEHLVQWMANPPVAFLIGNADFCSEPREFSALAGELPTEFRDILTESLPCLFLAMESPEDWEHVPPPVAVER